MSGNKGDDSESVQITKCSLDDLLMSLKAKKMALNSAVYMEDVDGKCSLREVLPIKAAHPTAFSVFEQSVYIN